MKDISVLQSRVNEAKAQCEDQAEQRGKLVLRLNDLALIVEGSLAKHQKALDEAEQQIKILDSQNEQLRGMVLTLLDLFENRSRDQIQETMQRLDQTVRDIMYQNLLSHEGTKSLRMNDQNVEEVSAEKSVIALRRQA